MAPKTYGDEDLEPEAPYHESSDEDFNPDTAPADDAASSSDEDAPVARKGKRRAPVDDELDSGDEVTIEAARKKSTKRKKGTHDGPASDDEAGGLIKTRAQRAVEKKETRPLARTDGATVDVDALWAQMTAAPIRPASPAPQPTPTHDAPVAPDTSPDAAPPVAPPADAPPEDDLLTITKTFVFAGQPTTEEKQIPRSALATHAADGWTPARPAAAPVSTPTPASHTRRPPKRPSRFDPNPTGYVRALPPAHQLAWPRQTARPDAPPPDAPAPAPALKPTKLNVVAKSRMDWTGFVDKAGIADELHEHGKSKENYMDRREFLAGVEARRDEEGRRGRVANATALT
ncbi:bucentaur or craniofacial development-domain-containing protein [Boeremia exigua]|uniref:bucentaur or craniofacial development-domain-containing protein n=1 Tax=Boeremia exigua TaxID=749465 RepID=UPI001E8D50CF|nr:bucentaur or craniofacial development-domain-containing protein [Boeremia exigua]KAH6644500.1 bucentaur or craniofacial development-domain-containing protein [Boeremia exigua]